MSEYSIENDPRFQPPAVAADFADEIAEYITTRRPTAEQAAQIAEQMLVLIGEHLRATEWAERLDAAEMFRKESAKHLDELFKRRGTNPLEQD
jgi:hypothetical protein